MTFMPGLLLLTWGGANAKKVYIFNLKTPIYPKIIYFFTHLYTQNIIFGGVSLPFLSSESS